MQMKNKFNQHNKKQNRMDKKQMKEIRLIAK
jgi:hypothetical protein